MPTQRHIVIKLARLKDKEKVLNATRENKIVIYKVPPIRLSSYFLPEAFQARRQ